MSGIRRLLRIADGYGFPGMKRRRLERIEYM